MQTRILNSWVASRTSRDVSIKISTQLQYRTCETVSGQRIACPHDYSEVNISTVYTNTQRGTYRKRIEEIVKRRLELAKIDAEPEQFFPDDAAQEARIDEIDAKYREQWPDAGRGNRPSDDAIRYARPDFMTDLGYRSKSRHSYSYAGFKQLVHISSGIIRNFLDPAAKMYQETLSRSSKRGISRIPHQVQNEIIRAESDRFFYQELQNKPVGETREDVAGDFRRLSNLITALGGTFALILRDKSRSERRVFSIAFSDEPDKETARVLRLGEIHGYLHVSFIGRKDGLGRTKLYILTRMLAPHFGLDPTSFAGYLFVTNENVRKAMNNPEKLLRELRRSGVGQWGEQHQLPLFDGSDEQ